MTQGDWHEGVLGIIAGRLTESYHRPAFALAPCQKDEKKNIEPDISDSEIILKGSGRSFGDFNLAKALDHCQDLLLGGGGHAEACGVTLQEKKFTSFCERLNDYYRSLKLADQKHYLDLKADLEIIDLPKLSLELITEIKQLEPFSANNTEPIFLLRNMRIVEASRLGDRQQHLRLLVWDQNGENMKLMWFYAPEKYLKLTSGGTANIWITLNENEFRGTRSIEGRILKIA